MDCCHCLPNAMHSIGQSIKSSQRPCVRLIGCLHDPANVQQTSSKCIQNTRANAGRLLDVSWIVLTPYIQLLRRHISLTREDKRMVTIIDQPYRESPPRVEWSRDDDVR